MKGWQLLFLITLPLVLIAIVPDSQASTNVAVNATIPSDKLLQGQITTTDIVIINNENFPVRIYKIGVHYDWMSEGTFYALDYGNNYVQIESNNRAQPGYMLLSCPDNASIGFHQYFFKLDITRYDGASASWVADTVFTPAQFVSVDSPLRQQSLDMLKEANESLFHARSLNYSGKTARSDLINATESMNEGWSAYNSNDFRRAINATYNVTLIINHARNAENEFLAKKAVISDITYRVNEKIAMLSSSSSPDTKRYLNESLSHLRQSSMYLDAEDFEDSKKEALIADSSVNNAINAQYYYQIETNNTDASKELARLSIDAALESLHKSDGLTSSTANSLMREARNKLEAANVEYNATHYLNATNKANVASALAEQAIKTEADYHQQLAREKINSVGAVNSTQAGIDMNYSRAYYNESLSSYAKGDYRNATLQADQAYILANNTTVSELEWKNNQAKAIPGFELFLALIALSGVLCLMNKREV